MDDLMWALQCQQKAEQSLAALKDLAGQALFTYHSLCVCRRDCPCSWALCVSSMITAYAVPGSIRNLDCRI